MTKYAMFRTTAKNEICKVHGLIEMPENTDDIDGFVQKHKALIDASEVIDIVSVRLIGMPMIVDDEAFINKDWKNAFEY